MRATVRRAALVAVALLATACVKPILRPYPERSAQSILDELRAREQKIASMRGEARVEYVGGVFEKVKLSANLLVERGGKFRFEVEGPMGALANLASDGQRFTLYDQRDGRFLTGPAQACNLARLLQVQLAAADISALFLGGALLDGEPRALAWDPKRGHEVLDLLRPDGTTMRVRAQPIAGGYDLVGGELRTAKGKAQSRITHESIDLVGELRFPKRTIVADLVRKKRLTIRYKDVELNVTAPDGVYVLSAPDGTPRDEVRCP